MTWTYKVVAMQGKDHLIRQLDQARQALLAILEMIPSGSEIYPTWKLKELLAHLAGWDFANLEAAQAVLRGELPAFYAYHGRDWQTYNAQLVAQYRRDDFVELLSSVRDSHHNLIDFLQTIPAAEFDKDRGVRFRGYKVTIARLLQAETEDEKTHHQQIGLFRSGQASVAIP